MDKRKKVIGEIVGYKDLKAAAGGGSGSGGGSFFFPGKELQCTIKSVEPGGYLVIVEGTSVKGFLPTTVEYEPGEHFLGFYVCEHNHRILLALAERQALNVSNEGCDAVPKSKLDSET